LSLDNTRRVYERLGREDPLWAVLTDDQYRHNRWDVEQFFETGREEIGRALAQLDELSVSPARGSALDFGCGVGRLTQALCIHFDRVVGVDISSTMVAKADEFNRFPDKCRYVVNTESRLAGFEDDSLDFIYSNISLQHSPPRYQAGYIREFLRTLRPGGVAMFQVRIGPDRVPDSLADRVYRLRSEVLKPWWKRLRGRPPVQVHTIAGRTVEEAVCQAGGNIVAAIDADAGTRKSRKSLRYVATRR
jgi:SAM-dependent methyltransferase